MDDSTGNDDWTGDSKLTAKKTIGNATGTVDPNGIIQIANGQYKDTGNVNITINKNMTIIGESQEGTIINGTGTNWIFNIISGVNVTLKNLTLTNATAPTFGAINNTGNLTVENCTFNHNTETSNLEMSSGGGAIRNSADEGTILVNLANCIFEFNHAARSGAAVLNYCSVAGNYVISTVNNCTFNNNTADLHATFYNVAFGGNIISYLANCTFTNNTVRNSGGAVMNFASYSSVECIIMGCNFINNNAGGGGAIYNWANYNVNFITCNVTNSNFINNTASAGGAIVAYQNSGILNLTAHFNRIVGNTATIGSAIYNYYGIVNATCNWWGSNTDPATITNLIVNDWGTVDSNPWLVLGINANLPSIYNSQTSTVTTNLLHDSGVLTDPDHPENYYHDPQYGHVPDGIPVTFSLIDGPLGTLGSQTPFVNGAASIIFTANEVGVQHVNATIDDGNITAAINIDPCGHVNVTKTADNYTPHYWGLVTFTITAHNQGPNHVEGLQITDILPAGLTLVSTDTHGFGTFNSGIWNIGALANGTTAILTLVVNATSTGSFTNWAEVTAQTTHDLQAWSQDNATINVPSAADIAVNKAFYDYEGRYEITSGNYWDIVSTRILVTNNGPDTALNVVISDILGTGLTFVNEWWVDWDISDWGWNENDPSFNPTTMTWTITSLPIGQTAALDIMTNLTKTGTLQNYAELTSSTTYDWNDTNNNDTAYLTVPPASYLSIYKEFMDLPWGNTITTAYYNDKVYAIVKVHNQGPDSTTSVNILDILNGLTWTGNYYVYRTPGSYPNTEGAWVFNDPQYPFNGTNWNAGNLSTMIGSSRWLALEVIVNRTGTVSNYAETVQQSSYPYQGYDSYTAHLTADIAPTSLSVDDMRGNKDETITLQAVLTDYKANPLEGQIVEFWIDGVKVGENNTDATGTAKFDYKIIETPGSHILKAVFAGTTEYVASEVNGELYVPQADLYIQITSNKNNPRVGEIFTLTYKLGNKGPDDAENVTITIPIPEGFHISSITGDGTWNIVGNNIIWTFNNVTVGDPFLYITGWTATAGEYIFTASINSNTYNINSRGVNSLSIKAEPQVTAATTNTIKMQNTGTPISAIILAILLVLGGLISTRKNQ